MNQKYLFLMLLCCQSLRLISSNHSLASSVCTHIPDNGSNPCLKATVSADQQQASMNATLSSAAVAQQYIDRNIIHRRSDGRLSYQRSLQGYNDPADADDDNDDDNNDIVQARNMLVAVLQPLSTNQVADQREPIDFRVLVPVQHQDRLNVFPAQSARSSSSVSASSRGARVGNVGSRLFAAPIRNSRRSIYAERSISAQRQNASQHATAVHLQAQALQTARVSAGSQSQDHVSRIRTASAFGTSVNRDPRAGNVTPERRDWANSALRGGRKQNNRRG